MCLFWLTRYISQPYPIMAITRTCPAITIILGYKIMVAIALFGCARSSIKRLEVFFACVMTFSFFINVITPRLSWYMILVSSNLPSKIRFELYPKTNTIFCTSILLLSASRMETIPIYSIWMTCSTAVISWCSSLWDC